MSMYTPDTVVSVQAFTRQPEGEDVIIGRVENGIFLAVPPEAVELLEYLAQGKSVGEASKLYQQKYGETPDLDDFLGLMESKGFVKALNENILGPATQPARQASYHFSNFPNSLAQR